MELTQLIEHWEATLLLGSRVPRKQKVQHVYIHGKNIQKLPKNLQTLTGWLIKMNTYNKFDKTVNKHNTCTVHINHRKVQEERRRKEKQQIGFSRLLKHAPRELLHCSTWPCLDHCPQNPASLPSPLDRFTILPLHRLSYTTPMSLRPGLSHIFLTFPNLLFVNPFPVRLRELRKHREQMVKAQQKDTS